MVAGIPVHDDFVHQLLWSRADRLGRVKVDQVELAATLQVNKFTCSRIVHRVLDAGRMREMRPARQGMFIVIDPEQWEAP